MSQSNREKQATKSATPSLKQLLLIEPDLLNTLKNIIPSEMNLPLRRDLLKQFITPPSSRRLLQGTNI